MTTEIVKDTDIKSNRDNNNEIVAENLAKRFRIYHEKHQTLKDTVLSFRRASYEEIWAIQNVNLEVPHGQVLGIIGRNGSGKSTLLKLIGRILEPTSGSVTVNGRIGMLLELGAGFEPDLTGRENVFLNASILGLSRRAVSAKFDEIVDFAELEKFIDTPVRNYSSGMYVRLGFSVAVHTDPDILLIDEVLAVGDEAFQKKCLDKILEFKKKGKTILFVTHDVRTARRICDRLVLLDNGDIVADGNPSEVIQSYHDAVSGSEEVEWGTRAIEILDVEFINENGLPSEEYRAGQSMTIRMQFKAHKLIDEPVFGISIYDNDGTRIAGTNTLLSGCHVEKVNGPGVFEFVIEKIPMLYGKFSLSPAITSVDYKTTYHWQESKYYFTVRSNNQEVGTVFLPGSCRVVMDSGEEYV